MRFQLLAFVAVCCSCASEQPTHVGDPTRPTKNVIDFKYRTSIEMTEGLREEFEKKYPAVQFGPDRRAKRVYVRYDDDVVLPPEALRAIKLKAEVLEGAEVLLR